MVRQEKESLTQQLLNTIKQKVSLSQELEAWQVSVCRAEKRLTTLFMTVHEGDVVSLICYPTGGHAVDDQSAGAAKGRGQTEGKGA